MPGDKIAKQKQTPEQMLAIIKIYQRYFELKEKKDGRR
jgi:hypothetical protein